MMARYSRSVLFSLTLVALIAVSFDAVSGAAPRQRMSSNITDQLTVALNGPTAPAQMALGSNIQTWADLTPDNARSQAALKLLQNWNQPMVRLHIGFRGENVLTLPEATPGSWDFSRLDAVISLLRARHISFFLDVRTAPPWMFDDQGQLPDSNFAAFALYMTRLVGWYNKGGFTDDNGVFHASGHINWVHVWEIWNEPKSASDIPVYVPNRTMPIWMQPDRYARLYDVTVTAMRAVDPTIMTGGPALGSWPDAENFYLRGFVQAETAPLDFLSFHFYAATGPLEPDAQMFDAITGARFLDRLTANRQLLDQMRPGQHIPIWITELNIDEISRPPADVRGTSPIAYAFLADALVTAEDNGVGLIDQFNLESNLQYGLMDIKTYRPYRTAWFYQVVSRQFPAGGTLLTIPEDPAGTLRALALIAPDGTSLRLLLGNIQTANALDVNGKGMPKLVHVTLSGAFNHLTVDAHAQATVWRFDAHTTTKAIPAPERLSISAAAGGQVTFDTPIAGYGVVIISIPLR